MNILNIIASSPELVNLLDEIKDRNITPDMNNPEWTDFLSKIEEIILSKPELMRSIMDCAKEKDIEIGNFDPIKDFNKLKDASKKVYSDFDLPNIDSSNLSIFLNGRLPFDYVRMEILERFSWSPLYKSNELFNIVKN